MLVVLETSMKKRKSSTNTDLSLALNYTATSALVTSVSVFMRINCEEATYYCKNYKNRYSMYSDNCFGQLRYF